MPLVAAESYRGRIVDSDGDPIAGGIVWSDVKLTVPQTDNHSWYSPNLTGPLEALVDDNGEFVFDNVPVGVPLILWHDESREDNKERQYLGQSLLSAGDERPRETF